MDGNIKAVLEYEGTAYHGWQLQENALTVQGAVETALRQLCGEAVRVQAAGRTDAGVHARGQVINFRLPKDLPIITIQKGMNAYLPNDITVKSVALVDDAFHARFSARQREYQYYLSTEPVAMMRNFCWQVFSRLDGSLLEQSAAGLSGTHDFGAFCRVAAQVDHKRCIVETSGWRHEAGMWIYRIVANRFLHGMVRTLVGTMVDVARGKMTLAAFQEVFKSQDRTLAGPAAPAKGLVLEAVRY